MIPEMINPLGAYWSQPHRDQIEVDETHALLNKTAFDKLSEYSQTIPTGVYEGKMWKRKEYKVWWLCWFGPSNLPDNCDTNYRRILETWEATQ